MLKCGLIRKGAMVILSKHIPTIAQLRPGVVTVTKEDGAETEKFFVSGGFAFIHPDNTCSVNAVEAIPLADLDADLARAGMCLALFIVMECSLVGFFSFLQVWQSMRLWLVMEPMKRRRRLVKLE